MISQGIYEHFKGSLYKVIGVAYHHETGEEVVAYYRCNNKGILIDIDGVNQPFFRNADDFIKEVPDIMTGEMVPRFKFIRG
jgi:hypothetical protein